MGLIGLFMYNDKSSSEDFEIRHHKKSGNFIKVVSFFQDAVDWIWDLKGGSNFVGFIMSARSLISSLRMRLTENAKSHTKVI